MKIKFAMNRLILFALIILAITKVVGIDSSILMSIVSLFFLLFAGYYVLFRGRLPGAFWSNLLVLIFGPAVLVTIVAAVFNTMPGMHKDLDWVPLLALLAFFVYLWFCWRWWQNRASRRVDQFQLRSNEREFIVPFNQHSQRREETDSEDEL